MHTKIHFKKFGDGDVIALFPEEIHSFDGYITSYQHVGQHGGASPVLMTELEDATQSEYEPLLKELTSVGYKSIMVLNNSGVTP